MHTFHVSPSGDDTHTGSPEQPLRTIHAAAGRAQPGDTISVHAGVYREQIDPPRGGLSDDRRITYQAAPGEQVVITGSEPVRDWEPIAKDLWQARIPNTVFGTFNPFADKIRGHWFRDKGRNHHTGAVYLNGHWLVEAASREALFEAPAPEAEPLWFGEVDATHTTILAQFPGIDPNAALVEINVRQSVFYPSRTGVDYLTVRGFTLRHAATPWAPPTTEQIGLLGTNWSKGWIIEGNVISHSICTGITLGKYHDPLDFGDKPIVEFTQSEDTYHGTIRRALEHGWNGDRVGHHRVRDNRISHCEMAGIAGSLGAIFCEVTGNTIHDIDVRRLFHGFEMAGIKFHGAIDTRIAHNHVFRCNRGLWLDWMSQGTRVTGNLFHDNGPECDLFIEVNHGPCTIDHNLFLSPVSLVDWSEGTLYAHNLFAGSIQQHSELGRTTPHHRPHSTEVVAFANIPGGDNRFFHNLFLPPSDLTPYDGTKPHPSFFRNNVFVGGATPSARDHSAIPLAAESPACRCELRESAIFLHHNLPPLPAVATSPIDAESVGTARINGLPFQDTDGGPLRFDRDYLGHTRDATHPQPGPFAAFPPAGVTRIG